MSNSDNVLSTIGLCKRAGKIITGFDAVVSDINKAAGVIITADLSDKTKKEVVYHCGKNGKKLIETRYTMEEIANLLGKKTGVIAILDKGLFKSLL
jgi:ribosomal protein L7Ae-like RNA K-turn-binding protein